MSKPFDPMTAKALRDAGLLDQPSLNLSAPRKLPSTAAGLPSLRVESKYDAPYETSGFVVSDPSPSARTRNVTADQVVFLGRAADSQTLGHEIEHLLARQNLGEPSLSAKKFADLVGDKKQVKQFLSGLAQSAPYIARTYGVNNEYLTEEFISKIKTDRQLHEVLATLAGAESTLGVDLTRDPELRKTLFSSPDVREAYNAVTGLRQTRLDSKDLPSYTRQKEAPSVKPEPQKPRKSRGFFEGGEVTRAGRTRLI